jgi:hypothetical protein
MPYARISRWLVHAAACTALLAAPIAPMPALAAGKAKFTDTCAIHRKPFQAIRDYQIQRIIGGVVVGALAGLVRHAIAPEYERDRNGRVITDANGNPKKKGLNAGDILVPAIAGGLIGWFTSLKQTARNQEELQAAVANGMRQDIDQFSPLAQKLADLGNCRRQQIFDTQLAFERGELDAKTAGKRLDDIEKWVAKDDQIISSAAKQQTKTVTAYARATAMADGQDPQQVEAMQPQILATMEAQSASYETKVVESYVDDTGRETVIAPPPRPSETRYVSAGKGANLRAEASPNAKVIKLLPHATPVEAEPATVQGWRKVRTDDAEGFMSEAVLTSEPPAVRGKQQPKAAKPKAAPAPPAPPKKAVRKIQIAPPARKPAKPRDRANMAVADRTSFQQTDAANRKAFELQMNAARASIGAGR